MVSHNINNRILKKWRRALNTIVPKPSKEQVNLYLNKWDNLENYSLQENSLDKLFFELCPNNTSLPDILIKCSCLNDFYSTNIYSIYDVGKHIYELNIDSRLYQGDLNLVNDIANVTIKNKQKKFYSFASKYCSHHFPDIYPIYDSYVEKVLIYFNKIDKFSFFKKQDLKDYTRFKSVILDFKEFYKLDEYTIKQIDRYIWQLGKEYFPRKY